MNMNSRTDLNMNYGPAMVRWAIRVDRECRFISFCFYVYFYLFDLDVIVTTVQLTVGVEEPTMTDDVKDSRSLGLRPYYATFNL